MNTYYCPHCRSENLFEDKLEKPCAECGIPFSPGTMKHPKPAIPAAAPVPSRPATTASAPEGYLSGMGLFAAILLFGGLVLALYFFLQYDPSVASYDGSRIANIGRLNRQTNGVIIGGIISMIGASLLSAERNRR
jgi:hypothetical protein